MSSSAKKITLEDLQQIIRDLGESHKIAQEAAQIAQKDTRELKEAQKAAQKDTRELKEAQKAAQKDTRELKAAQEATQKAAQKDTRELKEAQEAAQKAAQKDTRELKEAQKATQKAAQKDTRELKAAQEAAQKAAQKDTRELKEAQKETGREHKELHRKFKVEQQKTEEAIRRVSESLDKASGNFNNKWGSFMENLVKGDLVRLLNERDIQVVKTLSRVPFYRSKGEQEGEFDLIAVNGEEVVIVEVKTTLMPSHVDYFIEKLKKFRNVFPEYSDKRIYGSIAYLDDNNMAANYAKDKGLFVIKAPGGESHVSMITNAPDFTPKLF